MSEACWATGHFSFVRKVRFCCLGPTPRVLSPLGNCLEHLEELAWLYLTKAEHCQQSLAVPSLRFSRHCSHCYFMEANWPASRPHATLTGDRDGWKQTQCLGRHLGAGSGPVPGEEPSRLRQPERPGVTHQLWPGAVLRGDGCSACRGVHPCLCNSRCACGVLGRL